MHREQQRCVYYSIFQIYKLQIRNTHHITHTSMSLISQFIRDNLQQVSHQHLAETQQQFESSSVLIQKLVELRENGQLGVSRHREIQQKIKKIENYLELKRDIQKLCEHESDKGKMRNLIEICLKDNPIKSLVAVHQEKLQKMLVSKLRAIFRVESPEFYYDKEMHDYLQALKTLKNSPKASSKKIPRQFLLKASAFDAKFEQTQIEMEMKIAKFNQEIIWVISKIVEYEQNALRDIEKMFDPEPEYTPMKQIANEENIGPLVERWGTVEGSAQKSQHSYYTGYQQHPYSIPNWRSEYPKYF